MRFSIVVPLHRDSPAFRRCLAACRDLAHHDFEVVVVSDRDVDLPVEADVRFVRTGSEVDTSPAEKRDAAMEHVTGEVIAYLDDDAFPDATWLTIAAERFSDKDVGALGGPGVTPPGSTLRERVGGAVYESWLGSGPLLYRFRQRAPSVVDDYPAYNLFVRTDAVRRIGGWATTFYGGEDTHFCEALKAVGVLVHYEPRLVVYHHRRSIFRAHMKQIANVGLHRGFFARRPGTSRRIIYAAPLLGVVGVASVASMVAVARPLLAAIGGGAVYTGVALSSPQRDLAVRLLFPVAVLVHHASYAAGFVRGLFRRTLDR
jgi:glycosyltransferase involved in cell wall biosynthesis